MRTRMRWLFALVTTVAVPFSSKAQSSPSSQTQILTMAFAVDGQTIGKVANVKGITSQLETLTKQSTSGTTRLTAQTVTLKLIPTKAGYLKQWFEAAKAKSPTARQTATLSGLNASGAKVIGWSFTSAMPVKFSVNQLSSPVTESIVLQFGRVELAK